MDEVIKKEGENLGGYLGEFRKLLLVRGENVGSLEMTGGNYDNTGNLINENIPTVVTDFCEIGNYNDTVYFTFVIHSDSYDKKIFDSFRGFPNVQFYPFFDFNNTLYPRDNFDYGNFVKELRRDKYFQINFNYDTQKTALENLYQEYLKIKNIFTASGMKIVNQLQTDLTKETRPITKPQPEARTTVVEKNATAPVPSLAETVKVREQIKVVERIIYRMPPRFIQNLLLKARANIQERKRKKLDKIMVLFGEQSEIANKDVQKLLRTTRRSATRYFDQLEREGKITQVGKTGKGVLYIKKG